MRGYMYKKGETNPVRFLSHIWSNDWETPLKTYKKRFFILKDKFLYYFKSEEDLADISVIDLRLADEIEENNRQDNKVSSFI